MKCDFILTESQQTEAIELRADILKMVLRSELVLMRVLELLANILCISSC